MFLLVLLVSCVCVGLIVSCCYRLFYAGGAGGADAVALAAVVRVVLWCCVVGVAWFACVVCLSR